MQQVITGEQAKQITGGRTAMVPLDYEKACAALQACIDLDEASVWKDRASAFEAWAKIKRDKEALVKARCLTLKAARRCHQIADEEATERRKAAFTDQELNRRRLAKLRGEAVESRSRGGQKTGTGVLIAEGFTKAEAGSSRILASMSENAFNELLAARPIPPSLGGLAQSTVVRSPNTSGITIERACDSLRQFNPAASARAADGRTTTRVRFMMKWCEAFLKARE